MPYFRTAFVIKNLARSLFPENHPNSFHYPQTDPETEKRDCSEQQNHCFENSFDYFHISPRTPGIISRATFTTSNPGESMHDERRSQPENDWVQITEGLHAQKTGRIAGSYVLMEGKILLKIQFPTGETDYILQSKTTPCTEPQQ